nr:scarecrow-like protein 3 [Ipomoea trifida]
MAGSSLEMTKPCRASPATSPRPLRTRFEVAGFSWGDCLMRDSFSCCLIMWEMQPGPKPRKFEMASSPKWLFRVANHAIIETMERNKMVHIIDFHLADPTQWRALFQDLSADRKGSHISA